LMYDWLPKIDLAEVRDEWSNTRKGFSFIHHTANKLADAYLQLSTWACPAGGHGLLDND
jgi:hypothetical protein